MWRSPSLSAGRCGRGGRLSSRHGNARAHWVHLAFPFLLATLLRRALTAGIVNVHHCFFWQLPWKRRRCIRVEFVLVKQHRRDLLVSGRCGRTAMHGRTVATLRPGPQVACLVCGWRSFYLMPQMYDASLPFSPPPSHLQQTSPGLTTLFFTVRRGEGAAIDYIALKCMRESS